MDILDDMGVSKLSSKVFFFFSTVLKTGFGGEEMDLISVSRSQGYPCSSDKECTVGTYCHSPQHAPSRCLTCRRRKKRCHRDNMCCPGNRCSNCTFFCWFPSLFIL